jgi:hypothetical protein
MKILLASIALVAILAGCSTFPDYGVTESMIAIGITEALEKEGLEGAISAEQISTIISTVMTNDILREIISDVAADERVRALIIEEVNEYTKDQ